MDDRPLATALLPRAVEDAFNACARLPIAVAKFAGASAVSPGLHSNERIPLGCATSCPVKAPVVASNGAQISPACAVVPPILIPRMASADTEVSFSPIFLILVSFDIKNPPIVIIAR